jgi:hypothetical protein
LIEALTDRLLGELQLLHPGSAIDAHREDAVAEARWRGARRDGGAHLGRPDAKQLEAAVGIDALQHMLQCVIDAFGTPRRARHEP